MKKIIKINTKSRNYTITVENNSIIKNILFEIKSNNKIFIIIDKKVLRLITNLNLNNKTKVIKVNAGEKIKTPNNYIKLCTKLLKLNIDRSSTIITIGGGSLGDLSGFVASTILRGVKHILVPTTLLSQVDASIGGKNGINTIYGKNLIGTFLQPDKVIIDPLTLNTLTKREIRSGYAEILKHSLIKNKKLYLWLYENYKKVINLKDKYIIHAITESIKIKANFITYDEDEKLINKNSRAILNFGHTFGHALETMNKYNQKLTHGEAISIGMALATKISTKINNVSENEYDMLISHLKIVGLPYEDKRVKNDKIFNLIANDKKNSNNNFNFILLKKIGSAYFERDLKKAQIKNYLN